MYNSVSNEFVTYFLIKFSQNFIISMPKLFICGNVYMLKWLFREHGIYTNAMSLTPPNKENMYSKGFISLVQWLKCKLCG